MKPIAFFVAVCAFLKASCPAPAADEARLPYKMIYDFQQKQPEVARAYTNLAVAILMKSSRPEVKVSDLRVYIDSKEGKLPVVLDTNGAFTVPVRDSLAAENPPIVVNQPKGTMVLSLVVGLKERKAPTNNIRYSVLMRPLKDLETILPQMVPQISVESIQGLAFLYKDDADAAIVLHCKSGDRTYRPDLAHTVVIPLEPLLLEEDSIITFSSPPLDYNVAYRN